MTPAIAYPWDAAVCGYDTPTFGRDELAIRGGGFLPGEPAGVAPGWGARPRRASASPDGSFTVRVPVGEVPSVLDRIFPIAAAGAGGSSAKSSISLDADGCVLQTSRPAGMLTVRWGGNGFDPGSVVSLAIDGAVTGTARADRLGSGGAVVGRCRARPCGGRLAGVRPCSRAARRGRQPGALLGSPGFTAPSGTRDAGAQRGGGRLTRPSAVAAAAGARARRGLSRADPARLAGLLG